MIILNLIAILIFFASAAISFVIGKLFPENDLIYGIALGFSMLILDLLYRYTKHKELDNSRYFKSTCGGNIFYIPMWIIGLVITIASLFSK